MPDTPIHGRNAAPDQGFATGGCDAGATVLGHEARRVASLLAAWAEMAPVPVVAALADTSSAHARRHLEHLVRCGLAEQVPYGYRMATGAPGSVAPVPAAIDGPGWARVAQWCTAALFEAASVLGAVTLPGGDPSPIADRPAPDLPDRPTGLAWHGACYPMLVRVLRQQSECGRVEAVWRLALLMLNIDAVAGPGPAWRAVAILGTQAAQRSGDVAGEAMIGEYQGSLLLECGEIDAARSLQEQVWNLRAAEGDPTGLARSDHALGLVELRAGQLPEAELLFRRALQGAETVGCEELANFALLHLGATLARTSVSGEAEGLLKQARWEFLKAGSARAPYEADALGALAGMYLRRGQLPLALATAADALEVATEAGLPLNLAAALTELGAAQKAMGDTGAGLASQLEARAIYLTLDHVPRAEQVAEQITAMSRPPGV